MVVYLVFLKFADVKDANVVEPLAAVKSSEDEELLGSDHAGCMSLSSCRRFFEFERVRPSHCLGVQDVEVVGRNNFLERLASSVISTEQVYFVSYQICGVTSQSFGRTTKDLWLSPAQSLCVEDMQVLEMFIA